MSVDLVDPTREIAFENYAVVMGRTSFQTEGDFSKWVRLRAYEAVKEIPDQGTRKEVLAGIVGDVAAGKYTFDTPGQNYVRDAQHSILGFKEWLFLTAKQRTPFLMCSDGRKWFDRLWNAPVDANSALDKEGRPMMKQDELVEAWMEINSPNLQTPMEKTTDQ